MEGVEDLDVQALKDSPAYGARNVSTVAAGTGEALPGPAACGLVLPERGVLSPVTPGSGSLAGWASEAAVVPAGPTGQHNLRGGKGRCFVGAQSCLEGPGECR
jgi:hypothetical protein